MIFRASSKDTTNFPTVNQCTFLIYPQNIYSIIRFLSILLVYNEFILISVHLPYLTLLFVQCKTYFFFIVGIKFNESCTHTHLAHLPVPSICPLLFLIRQMTCKSKFVSVNKITTFPFKRIIIFNIYDFQICFSYISSYTS